MGDTQLGPVTHLSPSDVQNLWIGNGGDPAKAVLASAVVFGAENPQGNAGIVNDTPETGDYSIGLWQINYYGGLYDAQVARFGSPEDFAADPNLQARAAIAMSQNGSNWQPWGPDFGYSGYGSVVSAPLDGSKVGNWLAAHGYASTSSSPGSSALASLSSLPWAPIAAAAGILVVGGLASWWLLSDMSLPRPLRGVGRLFAMDNPARGGEDSMVVQSLLFPRPKWHVHDARKWARSHGYIDDDVDVTPRYIHLVQMPTTGLKVIRTIPMGKSGIKAHVGR